MAIKFTQDHEWISLSEKTATIGITDYAQEQLGEVVYVELPDIDRECEQGEEICVIESVKAAGEVKTPISGVVIEVNEVLNDEPSKVNDDPQGEGWFFKLTISSEDEIAQLMDEAAYKDYVESLA